MGPMGLVGPAGPTGATGPQGPPGIGGGGSFPGSLVFVQDGTTVPDGFTFVGFFFEEVRTPPTKIRPDRDHGRDDDYDNDHDKGIVKRIRINIYRQN